MPIPEDYLREFKGRAEELVSQVRYLETYGGGDHAVVSAIESSRKTLSQVFAHPTLNEDTNALVDDFAAALKNKLAAAEVKYGYTTDWQNPGWEQVCREHLVAHVSKGDPRDVAAYAAFCWHHGWSTSNEKNG